jgi:drug/metabolite transporter (DMT)-like permease
LDQQSLALLPITGVLTSCLAAFSVADGLFLAPRLSDGHDAALLVALLAFAASAFIQAWDERRRPRHTVATMPPPAGHPR